MHRSAEASALAADEGMNNMQIEYSQAKDPRTLLFKGRSFRLDLSTYLPYLSIHPCSHLRELS